MFTIWETTHSATWQSVSLLLTFGVAGHLVAFAGVLGDRYDRRQVMIISESSRRRSSGDGLRPTVRPS